MRNILLALFVSLTAIAPYSYGGTIVEKYLEDETADAAYATFPSLNADACLTSCNQDAVCKAAVFLPATKICALKDVFSGFRRAADRNTIGGVKLVYSIHNIDFPGGDYKKFETNHVLDCNRACLDDDRCRAFTYTGGLRSDCVLKDRVEVPGGVYLFGTVGGLK